MDAYARTRGLELVDRVDFSQFASVLDLGCGPGTYGFEIARRFPNTRVILLDLETPIGIARHLADQQGLVDRVEFIVADALTYETDRRFDAILVSNTLHMLGTQASLDLLHRCWSLIRPGGTIVVQAQYLDNSRTFPRWATLLNLIQRCVTPQGRNHAVGETSEWLRSVGFTDVRHVRFSFWNVNSCILARREVQRDVSA
jgi:C-methyltransferase